MVKVIEMDLESLKADNRKLKQRLQEYEEKYRNIIEQAEEGMAVIQEGKIKFINPRLAAMGSYSLEEMMGADFSSYFYPHEFYKTVEYYQQRQSGETRPALYELALMAKDGHKIPVEVSLGFTTYHGRPAEFIVVRDITDRKLAEEEVQWERDMAQKYMDIAGVIIIALNKRGEVTLINKKGCQILGWKEKKIIGKNWFDNFLPPQIRDEVRQIFSQLMAGETELMKYHNNPILTRSGRERIIAWHNTIMTNESGEIIGIISSGEDMTEHKKAEEALRESEERYRILVQTSPDAVTVTDLEGKINYVSRQVLSLHGFSSERELLGKSSFDLIAPEDRAKAMLNLKKTLKKGIVRNEEYNLLRKDGSRFVGEISSSVIRNKDGHPKMFIGTTRDITERKKAEEELKTSIKEKELLLQEIHHRVKNNLQIISSILDMSSLRIQDSQARGLITDARSIIQTMAFIHSQLYRSERFDRIEMGKHIRELINYLLALYARGKKINAFVDISGVYLSITQAIPCALVLNELISNAFKHAFKNRKTGTIEVAMKIHAGNRVFIKVRDNGVGICDQIDIYSTDSLGLKLVRNLVEKQLKGKIRVARRKGTEFTVNFSIA